MLYHVLSDTCVAEVSLTALLVQELLTDHILCDI